jgi:hypothetical protein
MKLDGFAILAIVTIVITLIFEIFNIEQDYIQGLLTGTIGALIIKD